MDYTANQQQTYWNVPSHFTPPGTPTAGDRITVPAGHWLHVVDSQEIGQSAPMGSSYAIQCLGPNCRIIFEADSTLRYRGELLQAGGGANSDEWCRYEFHPGSELIHDSTAAADPTNQHYGCQCGSGQNLYCFADFSNSNDPNNRVTIRSVQGGGRGWFDVPNFQRLGGAICPPSTGFADHYRWGGRDATNYAYTARYGLGVNGNMWRNMSFTDCGGIHLPALYPGAKPVLEDLWFGSTQTTYAIFVESAQVIEGPAIMRRITADKYVQWNRVREWEVYECIFGDRPPTMLGGPPIVFEKVIVIDSHPSTDAWGAWGGNISNLTFIKHNDRGNPHGLQTIPQITTNRINGYVFIYTGTAKLDAGDAILLGNGTHHTVVQRALVLDDKQHTGADSTLISLLGGPGATVALKNCTAIGNGVVTGEAFPGETGQITEMVDCLITNYTGSSRWKLRDINSEAIAPKVLNPVMPDNAHHNGGHGLAVGTNGKHYHDMNLVPDDGTIGANDVDADPEFATMDYLEDFDAKQGGEGTNQSAVDNILMWNHPTQGDPNYSPMSLFNFFLSEGTDNWAPTAAAFKDSGSGGVGTTIGAKEWKDPDPAPPTSEGGFDPFGHGVFE